MFLTFAKPIWRLVPPLPQDLHPRIHLTESDFASITRKGALCSSRGRMNPAQFEAAMREQLSNFCHRQLSGAARRGGDGEDGGPPDGLVCRSLKMLSQVWW
jgi:hypothetical protein